MTHDERVVALGNYCERLLADESFNELYGEFKRDRVDWMIGSAPHETKKREGIYAEMNALNEFCSLMKSYIGKRDAIINPPPSIADDSDDE